MEGIDRSIATRQTPPTLLLTEGATSARSGMRRQILHSALIKLSSHQYKHKLGIRVGIYDPCLFFFLIIPKQHSQLDDRFLWLSFEFWGLSGSKVRFST